MLLDVAWEPPWASGRDEVWALLKRVEEREPKRVLLDSAKVGDV